MTIWGQSQPSPAWQVTSVVVVAEVRFYREGLSASLAARPGLAVVGAAAAREAAVALVTSARPDVVVVKPCGFTLERTLTERDVIERGVLAVTGAARVYVTDGNAFFNRPGPRLVESAEIAAAAIHPERFAARFGFGADVVVQCLGGVSPVRG